MLKIRLSPRGKKHQITYRIVVAKSRSKLSGQYTDDLGFYTPQTKTLKIDQKKLDLWLKNGAQIALGLNRLLDPKKFPPKPKKIKKEEKPTEIKAEEKKEEETTETTPTEAKVEEKTKETKVEKKEEVKTEEKKEN